MNIIYFIDLAGTLVFAISGAIVAYDHKLDWFGAGVLASVTAIGGGTIRDLLLGNTPVSWNAIISIISIVFIRIISVKYHWALPQMK